MARIVIRMSSMIMGIIPIFSTSNATGQSPAFLFTLLAMESNTPETPDGHRPEEAESEKGPSETARLELDALRAMLGIRKRREQPDAQPPPDDHANSST